MLHVRQRVYNMRGLLIKKYKILNKKLKFKQKNIENIQKKSQRFIESRKKRQLKSIKQQDFNTS